MSTNTRAIDKILYDNAVLLLNSGNRTCDVAKELGINWSTVNNWKRHNGRVRKDVPMFDINNLIKNENDKKTYSYLLGMYLGCGVISDLRKTYALRIYLNKKYSLAINYTEALCNEFFENKIKIIDRSEKTKVNRIEVFTFSKNLPSIFPQHGVGKKKDREIKLTQWQEDIIDTKMLVKGLIISNGTIYRNEETKDINIKFYNRSSDIIDILEKCISTLNFEYRRFETNGHHIIDIFSLNDVVYLQELIDLKGITENTILLTNYTEKFKERIFQTIDTKEKAYWLGFIYSDGTIGTKNNRVGFCLSIKDVVSLERFCDFVGGDRSKIISYNKKEMVYYYVHSLAMKNDLMSHNVLPNKSNRIEFPIIEDKELFLAFFLGVYDGDGSEGASTLSCGNREFLEHCCERFDVDKSKIKYQTNPYGSCFILPIGCERYIEVLKNYNYSLERKRITTSKYFPSDDSVKFDKDLISLNTCVDCGTVISKTSIRCNSCNGYHKDKKFDVSKEELEKLVSEKPMVEIGKMFGVSRKSIQTRCKRLGVVIEKRCIGYWEKLRHNKL